MIHSVSKRGRPTGTSQFPEDRVALERMHLLCEQGMTAYKAAEKVVEEMALSELNRKQAIDRLRKKYPKLREGKLAAAKEEAALRSATPTPKPQHLPSLQDLRQIREHQEYLETPAGSFVKEHLIRVASDESYRKQLREGLEAYRLVAKLTE
jgi:hypothetical protein